MEGLIAFTLKRRVTVLMMALATALVGVIAYVVLPLELLPSGFENVHVFVRIPVQASNPIEVQEQVVRPTEEEIRTIPGIEELESGAGQGGAWIHVAFSPDTDIDLAAAELRDRLERARLRWPDQVRDYRVFRFNLDTDLPILSFAINMERYSDQVTFLVEEKVIKPLEALPGVAQVQCWGLLDDQIRVHVDRDRALSQNIGLYELTQTLRQANVELSGGEIEEGEITYSVRTDARLRSIEDVRNLPVNRAGLRLGEIARVEATKAVRDRLWLSDNKRSLWCRVLKESNANTVATAARVREHLETLKNDPRLVEVEATIRDAEEDDFGLMITGVLRTLRITASIGAVLAIAILFFFLRRIRLTLIITFSIPLSLLITVGAIYFSGGTMNVLAMLGMTIAIGMLIDNSIVVAENIARHRAQGTAPVQAAFRGASEVGLAITLSTLTTVAAFIPLIFMSDDVDAAFYVRGIGKPLAIAVFASLLVALVFIPLGTVAFYRRPKSSQEARWRHSTLVEASRGLYASLLRIALANRMRSIVLALTVVGAITAWAWSRLPEMDFMSAAGGRIRIDLALDQNFTLKDSSDVFMRIGDWVDARKEKYDVRNYWCWFDRGGGGFRINLNHNDKELTRQTALKLKSELPPEAGVKYRFGIDDQQTDEKKLNLSIFGPDPLRLLQISREISELVEATPGVLSVVSDMEEGQEELQVVPNREKTLRYGIDPRWLRGTIEYGIRGHWFSDLVQEGQEIPLIVQYEGAEERSLSEVRDYPVPTTSGGVVPLSTVADLKVRRGFSDIRRHNGRVRVRLVIETGDENQRAIVGRIKKTLETYSMPEGYSYKENKGEEIEEAMSEMTGTVLLAVTFVFLLMGILFESFILPLAVLLAIPLSWAGAVWVLGFTRTPVDMIGFIGVFVLVGIVVNNGIVLLDCAMRFLRAGYSRTEALIEAGRTRFRPIVMTAATTIVGLLPMALTPSGQTQISYKALSLVVIGGLALSTLLTLFFVPMLYTLLDDLRHLSGRVLAGLLPAREVGSG